MNLLQQVGELISLGLHSKLSQFSHNLISSRNIASWAAPIKINALWPIDALQLCGPVSYFPDCTRIPAFISSLYTISGTANATVACRYDAELQLLYALVEPHDTATPPCVYVPLATSIDIDMIEMARVQQRLGQLHANLTSISLAMVDSSGTTIYYRLTGGLK